MITKDAILSALTALTTGENAIIVTGRDSPLGGLTVQDLPEKQVQDGNVFSIRRIITIPAGVSNIIFDPTAIINGKNVGVRPPVFTVIGGAYVTGTLYVGSTYTGGATINGANRNQKSSNIAEAFIVELPTISTPGTLTPIQWLIPVPSTPGVATSSGGQAGGNLPFIIDNTLTQRTEFNNTDTSPAILEYSFTWSEKVL